LDRLERDARMLHVIEDEFGAGLSADRRVTGGEELERHRSERAGAGREAGFQWILTQRNFPREMLRASDMVNRLICRRTYLRRVIPINAAVGSGRFARDSVSRRSGNAFRRMDIVLCGTRAIASTTNVGVRLRVWAGQVSVTSWEEAASLAL